MLFSNRIIEDVDRALGYKSRKSQRLTRIEKMSVAALMVLAAWACMKDVL